MAEGHSFPAWARLTLVSRAWRDGLSCASRSQERICAEPSRPLSVDWHALCDAAASFRNPQYVSSAASPVCVPREDFAPSPSEPVYLNPCTVVLPPDLLLVRQLCQVAWHPAVINRQQITARGARTDHHAAAAHHLRSGGKGVALDHVSGERHAVGGCQIVLLVGSESARRL